MKRDRLFAPHVAGLLACALALVLADARAFASIILPPSVGVADTASGGTTISKPLTPEGALFSNPAGLVGFERATYSFGTGVVLTELDIESPAPIGYEHDDSGTVLMPSGGISIPLGHGWRFGWGIHGNTGASLDFPPEGDVIQAGFFTESATVAMPLAVAREVRSDLWVGAGVVPLFGYLRNRFTLTDTLGAPLPIKYTLRGPGLQAVLGATYLPTERLSFGFGIRTPGIIWMDGTVPIAGEREDVDLTLVMPMQIFAGVTFEATRRLELSGSARWTDSSKFDHSDIELPVGDFPFVPDSKDEWRFAIGPAFSLTDTIVLRMCTVYASRIVGNEGVSPLLFDAEDIKLGGGFSWTLGDLRVDTMVGHVFNDDRDVSAQHALILPGEYQVSGTVIMLGAIWER